jgi:hypothetical protein
MPSAPRASAPAGHVHPWYVSLDKKRRLVWRDTAHEKRCIQSRQDPARRAQAHFQWQKFTS